MSVTQSSTSHTIHLYDTIHAAIDHAGALCLFYEHNGEVSAQVLTAVALVVTGKGADMVTGQDSIRHAARSFRVDRIKDAHLLA